MVNICQDPRTRLILVSVGKQEFPAHPFHILFTVTTSSTLLLSSCAASAVGHHRASNPATHPLAPSYSPIARIHSNHLSLKKSSASEYAVRACPPEYSLRVRVPLRIPPLDTTRACQDPRKSGIIHPFLLTLFSLLRLHLSLGSLSCLFCANPRIETESCRAEELTPSQEPAA